MKYRSYIRWPGNNFGDNLNDVIFQKYLGITEQINYGREIFNRTFDPDCLLGLGTILSSRFKDQCQFTVFGSGAKGKAFALPRANILFLRGRISCRLLGMPDSLPVGDAAYSIYDYIQARASISKKYRLGIIPHMQNSRAEIYQRIPDDSCVIDVTDPVDQFIEKVSQCETIAAEAMHGAICADILRVPWCNIWINDNFRPEKWHDWVSAFDTDIQLNHIIDTNDLRGLVYDVTPEQNFRSVCGQTHKILQEIRS